MVDMVNTALSYGRALIVCLFPQKLSKVKESIIPYIKSEMQIVRFYLVGQMLVPISPLKLKFVV